jgi:hypothetical protein
MNTIRPTPQLIRVSLLLSLMVAFSLAPGAVHQQVGAESTAVALVRWPYLQQVTSTSAHIIWATKWKGTPSLEYGSYKPLDPPAQIISHKVTTANGDYFQHKAVLQNLRPDSWYYFRVYDNQVLYQPPGKRWFQTAPAGGWFSFIAFGDSGSGTPEQYQLRDLMLDRLDWIDLYIHTGDLAYPYGSYAEFQDYYFDVYRDMMTHRPLVPTIGNHEYYTDDARPYQDLFDLPMMALELYEMEKYYSFNWGNTHFVSLDSETPLHRSNNATENDMIDWLKTDLANDHHKWKIVIVHRPPYSSSPEHTELDVRRKLAPVFEQYGVDLVLSGHNHNYERTHPIRDGSLSRLQSGGVVYITTGGGGGRLYDVPGDWFTAAKAKAYHFVMVRVAKCTLAIKAIDNRGRLIDEATVEKCPNQIYIPMLP